MMNGENWLNRLQQIVDVHIQEGDISNERIASAIDISERHFCRKVKKLTGMSPQKYIRCKRLQKAKELLETGAYTTVKEVASYVGYINTSYFISQFEKTYGKKPFQVLKEEGWR